MREGHLDFIGLRNSRLNISYVPWWWSISRNLSIIVTLCVHFKTILTNMHTILFFFKSRTRETKHLSTDADCSTDAIGGWTKNTQTTLHTPHCTLHTPQCTLHTPQCTLHTPQCTGHNSTLAYLTLPSTSCGCPWLACPDWSINRPEEGTGIKMTNCSFSSSNQCTVRNLLDRTRPRYSFVFLIWIDFYFYDISRHIPLKWF